MLNQTVTIKIKAIDKYGRWIAELSQGSRSINTALIKNCLAWTHPIHTKSQKRRALEEACKTERRNIWSDISPIPPWKFRKKNIKERNSSRNPQRISHSLQGHPALFRDQG